jgi:hypothetical protein
MSVDWIHLDDDIDQLQSVWSGNEALFTKEVWMIWWAEELLFSEVAVCCIELWKNVESSAEVKGPMNEWVDCGFKL